MVIFHSYVKLPEGIAKSASICHLLLGQLHNHSGSQRMAIEAIGKSHPQMVAIMPLAFPPAGKTSLKQWTFQEPKMEVLYTI